MIVRYLNVWVIDDASSAFSVDYSAAEMLETAMAEFCANGVDRIIEIPTPAGTTFRLRISRVVGFDENTPESRAYWREQEAALKAEEPVDWQGGEK